MNNELRRKLEIIISPRLLLERIPVSAHGVAFVAWGVYNEIGQGKVEPEVFEELEEPLRKITEEFIHDHKFCIKLVDQLIVAAQVGDYNSFSVYTTELRQHPSCIQIVEQMFPKENL